MMRLHWPKSPKVSRHRLLSVSSNSDVKGLGYIKDNQVVSTRCCLNSCCIFANVTCLITQKQIAFLLRKQGDVMLPGRFCLRIDRCFCLDQNAQPMKDTELTLLATTGEPQLAGWFARCYQGVVGSLRDVCVEGNCPEVIVTMKLIVL